jgi:G:T-mismatch repair DNA endonuclease (very short patch repair protein)
MANYYKLSTEKLTEILQKDPLNTEALKVLNKRATTVFKCQLRARLYMEKQVEKNHTKLCFGSKTEAYATEEEILNGFACNVNDLSESEMEIYNGL